MITSIEGDLAQKEADHVVLNVGGVGIEIIAPYSTIERLNADRVFLYTRLVVREDSLTLYGFATAKERELFDAVLKISGIGPKLAVSILSTLSVDNIRNAVAKDRAEVISRVPGIGKKTAQKIVLELQDKFASGLEDAPQALEDESGAIVLDALTGLGYSVVEAQAAVQALPREAAESIEDRIRLALQSLGA